ncbi:hypothetical protein PHLGIDRAFT_115052 [Phlebiopsis gigantea 11061_1 CR5-6]|uniref:Prolyl 4-hydroxylase alpha subunit Fe(2+) 2OG dioxygenase domain-containing protein n=1 Tax=Phlebiopsis gigantea (strain 11061_1 CR5-6) TaxID=745531 RepID=A0A0C3NZP1_PHLG1|nr:hypothetical protein PHLGIDRAFT_115052 [Phlebiopsis gigantea 11061_1 CR5-6]
MFSWKATARTKRLAELYTRSSDPTRIHLVGRTCLRRSSSSIRPLTAALLFKHVDIEYAFDSASAVSSVTTPCVGFAAFYSDVEHEVTTVHSGYRVTLTYNLYLDDTDMRLSGNSLRHTKLLSRPPLLTSYLTPLTYPTEDM